MGSLRPLRPTDVAGTVARATCESPPLALGDRDILPEAGIVDSLMAAAAAHHRAAKEDDRTEFHVAVAALIDDILIDGNSARLR